MASAENRSESSGSGEKAEQMAHVEQVKTKERVPGHSNYYEKNGLRTSGDDQDHEHEPRVRIFLGNTCSLH
jgi:hypothetical protein